MSKEDNSGVKGIFLLAAFAGIVGIGFLRKLFEKPGDVLREQANRYIRDAVIEATADHFDWPVATTKRILENPDSDKGKWNEIKDALKSCKVTFEKSAEKSETHSELRVDVLIEIGWNKKGTEKSLVQQIWPWSVLPIEVRESLMERDKVKVEWEMPDFE